MQHLFEQYRHIKASPKQISFELLEKGKSPAQIYSIALAYKHIKLRMYVVTNLQQLEQISNNIKKLKVLSTSE